MIARQQADARIASAWRAGAVLVGWVVAALLRPADVPAWALLTDAGLACGGWWALRPGIRAGGPDFMAPAHWTKFLAVPPLVGFALALGDAWRLASELRAA